MAQFVGARQQEKPSTHLLSITKRADKSLKDYIVLFNTEAVQVEGYSDCVALKAIMAGLKPKKFLWSLQKNPLRTYTDQLHKLQRHSSVEELYYARRGFENPIPVKFSNLKRSRREQPFRLIGRANASPCEIRLNRYAVHGLVTSPL